MDPGKLIGRANIVLLDEILDLVHFERTCQHDERVGPLVRYDVKGRCATLRGGRHHPHPGSDKLHPWMRYRLPRAHDLFDLLGEVIGKRELQRNHCDVLPHPLNVETADDPQQTLYVVSVVRDDERVVLREGRDQSVVRDHRLDHAHHRTRVDIAQLHHPRDVLVAMDFRRNLGLGEYSRIADVARRDDFDYGPRLSRGEALDLQDGLEDLVGLLRGDLGRRNYADLAPHALIQDEVLAGDFADELGQDGKVHILKVHRDEALVGGYRQVGRDA